MRTSPGAFDRLKVDVLDLFTSPGAFEILCQVFFLRWLTPLKLTLKKKWIVQDLLTARELVEVWRWKERKVLESSEIFKFLGMIEILFTNLWNCGCCLCRRWCKRSPNRSSYLVKFPSKWQKKFENDLVAFELENLFLILTPVVIQTPLWRTFDGGSSEA